MDQLETAPRLRLKASGDEGVEHRKECAKADQEQVRIFALPPFRSNWLPFCRHRKHMRSQFLTEGVLRTFIRLNQLSLRLSLNALVTWDVNVSLGILARHKGG